MAKVRIETAGEQDVLDCVRSTADLRFFLDRLHADVPVRGQVFLAFDGADLVGHVYLRIEDAEETELRDLLPGAPLLQRLRVFQGHRGKGFGRELVAAAEETARQFGHQLIALGVDVPRPEPIGFYLHIGYQEWPHGLVRTFTEKPRPDGAWVRETEYCRIFMKELRTA